LTSKPYWPLKSIVSTAPVAATSSTSAGAQVASASSLKRTPGGAGEPPAHRLDRRLLAEAE